MEMPPALPPEAVKFLREIGCLQANRLQVGMTPPPLVLTSSMRVTFGRVFPSNSKPLKPHKETVLRTIIGLLAAACASLWTASPGQAQIVATAERASLPVREVTVFKDGHAFVLHSGQGAVDAEGNVQLGRLPTPVLGTFWPYSADKNATLVSVTAGESKTRIERPALSVSELLEANPGAQITVTQTDGRKYDAQIVATPRYAPDPSNAPNSPPGGGLGGFGGGGFRIRSLMPILQMALSAPPNIVLLKTQEGESAVPLSAIHSVTFKGPYKRSLTMEGTRNHLSLKLAWKDGNPAKTASVGMVYLQKGIRWIPQYRVSLDGKGHALISLQATLLNEMLDLNDVTCHLVVGVPTFWFKDTPDPISLQQAFPQLSRFFQPDSQTGYAFSNAIAGQSPGGFGGGRQGENFGGRGGAGGGAAGVGVDGIGTNRNEDLFLFTVKHVTLKKGQNMTLPITQFALDYKDVYRLDVPISPPSGVQPNGSQADTELARLTRTPRAQHRIRLVNKSNYPFTTAPALITNGARVIAQTLTSYTSVGATLDLALTTAGNVGVKRTETETKRTGDAQIWQGVHLTRYDLNGGLAITNYDDKPIDLEIVRYVPGRIDAANRKGAFSGVNPIEEDGGEAINGEARPAWWGWYNWPSYWEQFNGLNRVTWNAQIASKASADFTYAWHYFATP